MKDYAEIVFVLDRSGSMTAIQTEAIGGYNNFLQAQREAPGDARMTLVLFDDQYESVYNSVPLGDVPELTLKTFRPRGMTALYDAIGRAMHELGKRLAAMPEDDRPNKVIFVTLTDGEENSSRQYRHYDIANMIEHQQKTYNWEFIFLGASINTMAISASLNIPQGNTVIYSATGYGTQVAFDAVSKTVLRSRSS